MLSHTPVLCNYAFSSRLLASSASSFREEGYESATPLSGKQARRVVRAGLGEDHGWGALGGEWPFVNLERAMFTPVYPTPQNRGTVQVGMPGWLQR
jgi:hypothetical protein